MSKSQRINKRIKYNKDFDEAFKKIPKIRKLGINIDIKNVDELQEEEIINLYNNEIIKISKIQKYKVKHLGFSSSIGFKIGKVIPAVITYNDDNEPTEVHPYEQYKKATTINDYFEKFLKT
jgi:hypothetical protein